MTYEFHKTFGIYVKFHKIHWIFLSISFFIGIDFKNFLVILFHRGTFHWDAFIRSAYSRDSKFYPNIVLLMFSKQSILCYEITWISSKLYPPVRILACYQILTYLFRKAQVGTIYVSYAFQRRYLDNIFSNTKADANFQFNWIRYCIRWIEIFQKIHWCTLGIHTLSECIKSLKFQKYS